MQASLLFTLALTAVSSASPIPSRESDLSCSRFKPAQLFIKQRNGDSSSPLIPVALTNYKNKDLNGDFSPVLVSKNVDGSAVSPSKFDFQPCSSSYVQAQTKTSHETGHISAYGETGPPHRCLSSTVSNSRHSVFTNSICPTKNDESQMDSFFEWSGLGKANNGSTTASTSKVEFLGSKGFQNQPLTISENKSQNGAILMWNSEKEVPEGREIFEFVLQ